MTKLPVGTGCAKLVEQLDVESLIDHAKETETRMRNLRLILEDLQQFLALPKCAIDTARKCMTLPDVDSRFASYKLCPPVKTRSTWLK